MNIAPDCIYVGDRETIITEIGGMAHIYEGAYLLYPNGRAEYDAEGVDTIEELNELIKVYEREFPGIKVYRL